MRNPLHREAFQFALATGMRRGEVLSLEWRNVDLESKTASLPITKNGEEGRLLDVARGGSGDAQAIQWALRNRSRAASGWHHDQKKVEVSGPDGGAVQMQADLAVIDSRLLTADQRVALKQARIAAQNIAKL